MRKHIGIFRSMESSDVDAVAAAPEAGAGADSLETDLTDVAQAEQELQVADAETEEAAETKEAMESMIFALESAMQTGGLDRNGAAVLAVATDHMLNRMGYPVHGRGKTSLESFGGAGSRQQATRVALEGLKAKVKEIWDAIIKALKDGWKKVKDFFLKIFGAAEKLEARAKALGERVNGLTGSAKEKDFEDERIAKALWMTGNGSSITAGSTALKETAVKIYDKAATFASDVPDKIKEVIAYAIDKKQSDAEQAARSIRLGAYAGQIADIAVNNPKDEGFGEYDTNVVDVKKSAEMPGNAAMVLVSPKENTTDFKSLAKWSFRRESFDPKKKELTNFKLNTLDKTSMGNICDEVEEVATKIKVFRGTSDKLSKLKDDVIKMAEKMEKVSFSEDTDAAKKKAGEGSDQVDTTDDEKKAEVEGKRNTHKELQAVFKNFGKFCDQPFATFGSYALTTGKCLLDYVELSVKQYEASKD